MRKDTFLVRDVMVKNPVTASTSDTIRTAVKKMAELNIGAIPVVDSEGKVVGIFTERDLLIRVAARDLSLDESLESVMTKDPVTIKPDATVEEAKEVMAKIKARHLPVVDEKGVLVGVVSLSDIEFSTI